MHDIHVLCYPSHTTHVFQGLDVICFGLLKRIFNDERRKFEQQGYRTLKKEHFLQVYAAAHVCALTADVVKAAFAKTGVVPYNPEAIKTAVFKPSIESSTTGSGTPIPESIIPPTPIRLVRRMIEDASKASTHFPTPHASGIPTPATDAHLHGPSMDEQVESLTESLNALQASSVGFLFSEDPVASSSEIPTASTSSILPPMPDYIKKLVKTPAKTEGEQQYLNALIEMCEREAKLERFMLGLQANNILQGAYLERVRGQLHAKEAGKARSDRLMGDGMPVALTGDEFYERVVQKTHQQAQDQARKAQAQEADAEYRIKLAEWQVQDKERIEANKARRAAHKLALSEWNEAKKAAKAAKSVFNVAKPTLETIKKTPKPSKHVQPGVEEEDFAQEIADMASQEDDSDEE